MFNVQRAITPKVDNQSYGSCVLHFVLWCCIFVRNFVKISRTVSELSSRHQHMVERAIFNIYDVQRATTPKLD